MPFQTGRRVGRISGFVAAGVLFAAGLIVGLIPYSSGGYSSVCPSAIVSLAGGRNSGQSLINMFSGGRCDDYASTMTTIMAVLMLLAVAALVGGILLRKRQARAGAAAPGYTGENGHPSAPAQPGYAPSAAATVEGGASAPAPAAGFAGSVDTKLLLAGAAGLAGIVLVSFLVDWLGFLPGIIELLLWTAVGLTAIWQLKRRAAGADAAKTAEAEAWNPAAVGRRLLTAGRGRLEVHRAERREAERSRAAAPAPWATGEPDFKGDDGMARSDVI